MAVIPTRKVCLTELTGCQFGFLTPEKIRALSVKHITIPTSFDRTGQVVDGGPYDRTLGPIERSASCATCGMDEHGCLGHYGHIELPLPVYNAFFIDFMFKALKATCLYCYKLRPPKDTVSKVEAYLAQLVLLRSGDITTALSIRPGKTESKITEGGPDLVQKRTVRDALELLKSCNIEQLKSNVMTSSVLEFYSNIHKEFLALLIKPGKCANCGCTSPSWKKEGASRVLVQRLSTKAIASNAHVGCIPCNPVSGMPLGQRGEPDALNQMEAIQILKRLWEKEYWVLDMLGGGMGLGKEGYRAFFFEVIPVLPNKYRPCTYKDGFRTNHSQTTQFIKILNVTMEIRSLSVEREQSAGSSSQPTGSAALRANTMKRWNELQTAVNQLVDSSFTRSNDPPGVRQFLEKKEGLFRKYMMGKRVNFAARSTISPDINLGVGEVGIPPEFARTLSFPEKVTEFNLTEMKKLIIRGAHQHPGAVAVEDNKGTIIDLAYVSEERRMALARRLYVGQQGSSLDDLTRRAMNSGAISTVFRHLKDGDMLLTNRQPTLHKASLMAHKARVLKGERTIRFHYANCAAFNADFDGDEMNLHFPQDHLSRAEGYGIIHADHQYINPTNGAPLRGLIQDNIVAGVLMTMKDTFFRRVDYMHLLFVALSSGIADVKIGGPPGDEPPTSTDEDIIMQSPAIMKPVMLWTGKQVISSVLANLSKGRPQVTTAKKCKTPYEFWGDEMEGTALVRQGHLLTGVLDKSQYQSYGLVHACQELYGDEFAGKLLSSLSRLFVRFLQMKGFTCGIGDAFLNRKTERRRKKLLKSAEWTALQASAKMMGLEIDPDIEKKPGARKKEVKRMAEKLGVLYRADPDTSAIHDSSVKGPMHQLSSEVSKLCLPDGVARPFRHNGLTVMTSSGAKGSLVNFSQISCLLGQQELEGRRVPRMMSGKTLPCFAPYDPGARSGGFISDRFLTGLRPPEYYFHCMAGREGLVDTSVKTASSGYLQRCLIKNMEALRVQYDNTVRDDTDGTVYQFYYGEDGLDVVSVPYLDQFKFIAENSKGYKEKLQLRSGLRFSRDENLRAEEKEVKKWTRKREKLLKKGGTVEQFRDMVPVMSLYRPTLVGSMSERMIDMLWDYRVHNPNWLLHDSDPAKLTPKDLEHIVKLKYMESLAAPGEAVGILAAQSVGEPSTQMTLNTFHMAGRGEANVTLGIPRLREILMTASTNMKTPVMILPLKVGFAEASARRLANQLRRIRLGDCFKELWVEEWPASRVPEYPGGWGRRYNINVDFHPLDTYPAEIGMTWDELESCFKHVFVPRFKQAVRQEISRINRTERSDVITKVKVKEPVMTTADATEQPSGAAEAEDDGEEAKRQYRGGRGEQAYDAPDVDDEAALKETSLLDDAEEEPAEEEESEDKAPPEEEPEPEPEPEPTGGSSSQGAAPSIEQEAVSDAASLRCTLQLTYQFKSPKLSMLSIAERVAATALVRSKAGIQNCYVVKGREGEPYAVQTDGVSFETAWEFADTVDVHQIRSNDIAAVLKTYGVEAARSTIIQECKSVFGAYGISVDPRHLGLIADYMTNQGGFRGCNYRGIATNPSAFLKMSFERSTQFLREAVLHGSYDPLNSPSARVIVGRPPLVGTGGMEIHQILQFD